MRENNTVGYERIVDLYELIDKEEAKIKISKKHIKREAVKKIIAAWLITVPAAAVLSAAIYFMIRGIMV